MVAKAQFTGSGYNGFKTKALEIAGGTVDESDPTKIVLRPGDSGLSSLELSFAYGDATPELIGEILAGVVIHSVSIIITEAFDGTGAALSIGDAGDTERLLPTTHNDPTAVGNYEVHPAHEYGSDTNVNLYITPGSGASQGAGLVVIAF